MKVVGQRQSPPVTFSASAEQLLAGVRFNDELHRMLGAGAVPIPKGVRRFATHAQANADWQNCVVANMVKIARGKNE